MFCCFKCRKVTEKELNATVSTSSKKDVQESDYTFSLSHKTLIKPPNSLPKGYPIFIVDSTHSNFYILDSAVQVTLECLENCNVIIGPTEGSVFIRDCKNTIIVAYCQQFRYFISCIYCRARDCLNLNVFLYSSTEPVIETSENIIFHPNTLKYDGLDSQMQESGLCGKPNKWNIIYDFNDSWQIGRAHV